MLDRYALEGPASILSVEGETERLKWVGLYPQRQGGDAFMLRVKIPGGRLTAAQARLIGEIADEHARGPEPHPLWGDGYLDLTTRQDIQLHWIKIGAVPEIWRRLEAVGITTVQACGDSARNVLCCPVSGIDGEEVIDAYPIAVAISDFFTGNREYANLPRKFKMSVTGCREDCAQAEINDLALVPARLDDGTVGFNLLVGGGLSDGPRLASDVDVFVHPDDAVEISRAVAQLFDELGNRDNRWTCRLRYLVQELGPETFRAELAARARVPLTPAGEHLTNRYRGDHIGVHPQRQEGLSYVGVNVTVGRMTGTNLVEMARLAETFGDGEIRLTTDQNLILTGVPEEKLARAARRAAAADAFAESQAVRAGRGGLHRQRVLPPRHRRDQGAGVAVGAGARPPGGDRRRGHHPPPLLRLLGLLRSAADRRRRLPGGDGQDRRRHRRGGRHRAGRQSGPRRRLHRLGRGRQTGDRGAGRHGPPLRPLRRGAA